MSRDAGGNYNLPAGNPVIPNTVIETAWANPTMADIAAALSDSLSRSGKGGMGAPLDMGGFKISNTAPASIATDVPQAVQVRDTAFNRLDPCSSDSTGNNYAGTSLINVPPVNGTTYVFAVDKNNTGPMTLTVNGGSALPILINGGPVPPGIILTGAVIGVMFLNLTWRLTNTAGIVGTINTVQSDNLDAIVVTNDLVNAVAVIHPNLNIARGLAQLDSNAKVPIAQMPFTALRFLGMWNAGPGINPPNATTGGDFYTISGAGTLTIYRVSTGNVYTPQATVLNVGDNIVYNTAGTVNQPTGWYYSPAPGTAVTAANVSVVATPTFPTATNAQSWFNQADPVINGKLAKSGGTMTGPILQPTAPSTAQALANKQYVDDSFAAIPPNVASFNTRTGAVALLSADVTGALGYTPANSAGQVFTGAVGGTDGNFTGTVTGKAHVTTPFSAAAAAVVDFVNGQTQLLTLAAPLTITAINNIPVGSILRLTLIATNNTVTWPASVAWPLGSTPDLALGPLKKAIVVLENDGTKLLASSSAY